MSEYPSRGTQRAAMLCHLPGSASHVAAAVGVNQRTVYSAMLALQRAGLVVRDGWRYDDPDAPKRAGRGRPPTQWRLTPQGEAAARRVGCG
jgi:predicted ArsR family transcriptional regulator